MKVRTKVMIALLVYLTGCSAFFGSVLARKHIIFGLASMMIAQGAAAYCLLMVERTEKKQ